MPSSKTAATKQHELTPAFLDAWTATQALWLGSRQGAMPHQVAVLLGQAHAAMEKAVTEAETLGILAVERDEDRRITAIRPVTNPSFDRPDVGE